MRGRNVTNRGVLSLIVEPRPPLQCRELDLLQAAQARLATGPARCHLRKRVFHEGRKNFQLDLFAPDDGHFEYSTVVTSLDWDVARLWHLMAGRGGYEKSLGELKHQFAFDAIPTNHREANGAWQMMSVLAFNLVRSFQIARGARRRGNAPSAGSSRAWAHCASS